MIHKKAIKNVALILVTIAFDHYVLLSNGLAIDQQPVSSQATDPKIIETPISNSSIAHESTKLVHQTTLNATLNQQQLEKRSNEPYPVNIRQQDHRRPVWALAHMVNSIKELEYRLRTGANAIEADVTFSRDGMPLFTYHGPPCDCLRHCHQQENFNDYLNYVRDIAIDNKDGIGRNLSLLFLDLKLDYLDQRGKINAGIELAKSILDNLFINITKEISMNQQAPSLYLILSINHVTDVDLVRYFIHQIESTNSSHLMDQIGFDVGMNDDLQLIESMWRRFSGIKLNIWQGDGFTNCFSPFYRLERLSKALVKRNNKLGYPSKVYHWTIDLHDRMRESLIMGVDAIMTNHPERLMAILQEPDIAHEIRLATRYDDPFRKLTNRQLGQNGETARYQRSANSASGGLIGNIVDVLSSWFNYIREIPFLSFPTTTRLFSRSSSNSINSRRKSSTSSIISKISLKNQPEYKVDNSQANSTTTLNQLDYNNNNDTTTSLAPDSTNNTAVEGGEQSLIVPYDGPKWYTSLVSNVLVSVLNFVLPVQST